ncbi:MAG: 16S rRNA (cytosine(1402)-N(4))-methyltransferase RsmH [Holosporaceae bacterium]|jgi:16S rRNA (cytosine1402-N4)-methyltransferase|nr:16S rRNA (cytosine(1402)-N(4))-methyltransferase RsmH [Holosporaceae bacterium]
MEHISVLLKEVLAMLSPKNGGIYFDGTFGGGGYSRAILKAANCRVIACDRDPIAESMAANLKRNYEGNFDFSLAKFSDIRSIAKSYGAKSLDGVVLDLGVSNFQLADPSRGFSFKLSGPLLMGMGLNDETALGVIRKYSEKNLADIIYQFGEEPFSRRIAKNIKLNLRSIQNTKDLVNVIHSCVKKTGKIDSATKTFQALRIFVNDELGELERVLSESVELLNPSGKIIVVSFHSLEDRIVKLFFRKLSRGENKFQLLNKKPTTPSEEEILLNQRSRSAKLRGISML